MSIYAYLQIFNVDRGGRERTREGVLTGGVLLYERWYSKPGKLLAFEEPKKKTENQNCVCV